MSEAKLSSKNQIVIPREARNALGLKAGDRLLLVVRGDTVILLPKPSKYHKGPPRHRQGSIPAGLFGAGKEELGVSASAIERLLRQHRKVGIDTSVFIYQVEENAKYVEGLTASSRGSKFRATAPRLPRSRCWSSSSGPPTIGRPSREQVLRLTVSLEPGKSRAGAEIRGVAMTAPAHWASSKGRAANLKCRLQLEDFKKEIGIKVGGPRYPASSWTVVGEGLKGTHKGPYKVPARSQTSALVRNLQPSRHCCW
jgi:AbrB family looped-hinge helix DNA binding protein